MIYERKVVTSSVEKQIITAMIVSTKFLAKVSLIIDLDFFVNEYAQIIGKWTLEYYAVYKKAPQENIQQIYEAHKSNIDKAAADLISTYLVNISDSYLDADGMNDDYVYDNALAYFDRRDMELRMQKAQGLLLVGKDDEAKSVLTAKTMLNKAVGGWETVFDKEAIIQTYNEEDRTVFSMPGALGEMIGPIQQGWFIAVLGGFKIGKSFSLQEFAVSALTHRKRVAFFSLEMGIDDCRKRFYSRITGKGGEGDFLFPVFDCLKNQTGSCPKSYHRTNTVTLRASVKDKLEYNPVYAPCTYCRTNSPKDYIPETYFQPLTVKKPSLKRMIKDISSFESMYGDKILFRAFPRFSASVDDLRAALDALELQDSFIPDVVVVDYADILRPSKGVSNKEPRYGIDDIWKNLSALAAERRCIVITASQGNRGSLKKVQKEEADVAEWIGKIGHVDMFIALNQTPMEKKKGVLRYSLLAHRHKDFNPMDNVIVLQHLKTGQACLDSEVARKYHISTEDTED